MTDIIKIQVQNQRNVVSAKELYLFLGFDKSNWSRWIAQNITGNQFAVENEDYSGFVIMTNGNESMDYALSIDFAKKLSMMSRTQQGEVARNYFIQIEKQLKAIDFSNPETVLQLAQNWKLEHDKRIQAEQQIQIKNEQLQLQAHVIQEAKPKIEYFNEVLQSESLVLTNVIAKELGMTAIALNQFLKLKGIMYKSGETWVLYRNYQNQGYTKTKTHTFTNSQGQQQTAIQTCWTERGRQFLHNVIKAHQERKMSMA